MKRVVTLTDAGRRLGEGIVAKLDAAELWHKPEPFGERVRQAFEAGDALIMICATGIVLRTIAPVIASKHSDPPVLVLDEAGRHVVPLLSGHEGGANELARQVAALIGAEVVITTANPYLAPVYCVGMGCERGCGADELRDLFDQCLRAAKLKPGEVASINSIDLKHDEAGLLDLARIIDQPYQVFDAEHLKTEEHLLSTRSDYVFETVGVYGVAE